MKKFRLLPALACAAPVLLAQTTLTSPGGGNVTHCASHVDYPGTKAFDQGGTGDAARWLALHSALPDAFVTYSFKGETVVNGYAVFGLAESNNGLTRDPKSWSLEGSSNMVDWVLADAQTHQTNWVSLETRRFETAFTNSFQHWRFTIHENNGMADYAGIQELELYGYFDFAEAPKFSALPHTQTDANTVRVNGSLDEGLHAVAYVAWGETPGGLAHTNEIGTVTGPFNHTIPGLTLNQTYGYTFFGTNETGYAELPAPLSFTVQPWPVNLAWSGASGVNHDWHNADNWSPAQVPTRIDPLTINANAPATDPIVIDAPAESAGVTFTTSSGEIHFNISTNWLVNGELYSINGTRRVFNLTGGTLTAATNIRFYEAGQVTFNISGAGTALVVSNSFNIGGYNNTQSYAYVDDGAHVDVGSLSVQGENNNGVSEFWLRNASMLVRNTLNLSSIGVLIVTNSSLTVNNILYANGNGIGGLGNLLRFDDGARVRVATFNVQQYNNWNANVRQYGGSVEANNLNMAGTGQGGTGTGGNNAYRLFGGTLTVTNTVIVGNNGQAVFEQSGGFADFRNGVNIRSSQSENVSRLVFNEGAKAVFGGLTRVGNDADWQPGILRVEGNAAQNGNLSLWNVNLGAGGVYNPVITENGFTPVHVSNQLRVFEGFAIRPETDGEVPYGDYTVLTWDALNTTTGAQLEEWAKLAPDADAKHWKVMADAEKQRVILRYFGHPTLFMLK